MSIPERIALFAMLISSGLWAGIVLVYAIERVNLWSRMPLSQYVIDFRRSVRRVDPLQPILAIAAVVAASLFAANTLGIRALLAWTGVALVAAVIIMSIAASERINSSFRRRAEGEAPPNTEALRARWRTLHYVRTVPAVAAFLVFSLAAAWV